MRKLTVIFIIAISIIGCSEGNYKKQFKYKWGIDGRVIIENGSLHSYIKYDPVAEEMSGDTLFPISMGDSTIIIKYIVALGEWQNINGENKFHHSKDSLVSDTLLYDFKLFLNHKILLLYKAQEVDPSVLHLLVDKPLIETNRIKNVRFTIAGYSIGDSIDRNLFDLKEIKPEYKTEFTRLNSDENIEFAIIGGKFISEITQHNINDTDIKKVIKTINSKMGISPNHNFSEIDSESIQYEYYRWEKNGVEITLQNPKYLGSDINQILKWNKGWNLYYTDNVYENIFKSIFKKPLNASNLIN
ncbi:MAG: hypothetical protein HC905_02720 [Bacteroidales bacterium]|nr:hypothetical protein [Bacteroidales bacterium]